MEGDREGVMVGSSEGVEDGSGCTEGALEGD